MERGSRYLRPLERILHRFVFDDGQISRNDVTGGPYLNGEFLQKQSGGLPLVK